MLADLAELEEFRADARPNGVDGIIVDCGDCGEQHYFAWELMAANLRALLGEGRTHVHEPAFAPEPGRLRQLGLRPRLHRRGRRADQRTDPTPTAARLTRRGRPAPPAAGRDTPPWRFCPVLCDMSPGFRPASPLRASFFGHADDSSRIGSGRAGKSEGHARWPRCDGFPFRARATGTGRCGQPAAGSTPRPSTTRRTSAAPRACAARCAPRQVCAHLPGHRELPALGARRPRAVRRVGRAVGRGARGADRPPVGIALRRSKAPRHQVPRRP